MAFLLTAKAIANIDFFSKTIEKIQISYDYFSKGNKSD